MHPAAPVILALLIALPGGPALAAGTDGAGTDAQLAVRGTTGSLDATDRWIVVLRPGAAAQTEVEQARRLGVVRDRSYSSAVRGYAARLSPAQVRALRADPATAAVVPDGVISTAGQSTPRGIKRIDGPVNPVAHIDGVDERVDADVAIVDTGIDRTHPDLNVAGGYNCTSTDRNAWDDPYGHGTHVAGTVGALDNGIGVVGVAPGVRLWSVRVLNSSGDGLVSWYLCGIDWIAAQREMVSEGVTRPLFEAVNMSVAKTGTDDHSCGLVNGDLIHQAICRLVASGVTVVAAAGNNAYNAARMIPAAYDEVITVSALADTDGRSGGLGGNACLSWGTYDQDDTFADFSNYGSDVDLIAPGKCVLSTIPGGYGTSSGTSMATPHVTGAVALYKASRPDAAPAEVRAALRAAGSLDWATATDPDTVHEPLLDLSRIVALGDWTLDVTPSVRPLPLAATHLDVPLTVVRAEDVANDVALAITAPDGFGATLSADTVTSAETGVVLGIDVPTGLVTGTYTLSVTATSGDQIRRVDVPLTVDGDLPTVPAPRIGAIPGTRFDTTSFPALVTWAAGADPTSPIAGYQLQVQPVGGSDAVIRSFGPTVLTASRTMTVGVAYAVRTRALDAAGNVGAWAETAPVATLVVQDGSSLLRRTGTWTRWAHLFNSGGSTRYTRTAGASTSLTFTGRAIAVVMPYGIGRGKAQFWLDGVMVGTVDTYRSVFTARRVAYAHAWDAVGPHVIKVVVLGTAGRPRVDVDAFVVLR